jgi:hypothetical protein
MTKRAIVLILALAASSCAPAHLVLPSAQPTPDIASPTPDAVSPIQEDCCPEWAATNFPIPALSARGDHCPADAVPEGSDVYLGSGGRIEISFFDVAYEADRTFILDMKDPACFETHATRRAIFFYMAAYVENEVAGFADACERVREGIRAGSMRIGDDTFDLHPAQPYVDEVCVR